MTKRIGKVTQEQRNTCPKQVMKIPLKSSQFVNKKRGLLDIKIQESQSYSIGRLKKPSCKDIINTEYQLKLREMKLHSSPQTNINHRNVTWNPFKTNYRTKIPQKKATKAPTSAATPSHRATLPIRRTDEGRRAFKSTNIHYNEVKLLEEVLCLFFMSLKTSGQ